MQEAVAREFARANLRSPAVALADGTWSPYVPSDAQASGRLFRVWYPTDVDTGPLHLSRLKALDPKGALTTAMLHDHEDNLFIHQWGMINGARLTISRPQRTSFVTSPNRRFARSTA